MGELTRFGVSVDSELLEEFEAYVARQGTHENRSEVIRRMMREQLVNDAWQEDSDTQCVGTITLVFDHHANDLSDRLDAIQHEHFDEVIVATHVHLDAHNCLEVIVVKGKSSVIRQISDAILGTKGVKHGRLVTTTTGEYL